jgi:hypothetical protein
MTDWKALSVGSWASVTDADFPAQVHRTEDGVYVIMRHVDGGWMRRVWIRKAEPGWRIAEQQHLISSRYSEDLDAAIQEGLVLSRTTKG